MIKLPMPVYVMLEAHSIQLMQIMGQNYLERKLILTQRMVVRVVLVRLVYQDVMLTIQLIVLKLIWLPARILIV